MRYGYRIGWDMGWNNGMKYGYRTGKAFRVFIGKHMINVYWIESVFEIEYVDRIV